MDNDLLVLLEPGTQGVPLEPGPAGQSLHRGVVAVDPQRGRPDNLADL
jgi:hypothetical protein